MISILYFFSLYLPFLVFPLSTYEPFELPKVVVLIFISTFLTLLYKPSIVYYRNNKIKHNLIRTLILSQVIVHGTGVIFGINPLQSLWGQYYRYQGFITQLALCSIFLLVSNGVTYKIDYLKLFRYIALSALGISVLVIVQSVAYHVFHTSIYVFLGRMTATLGNPNFTGSYLVMCFPFVYHLLHSKPKNVVLATFLFGIAILLTQSRGSVAVFLTIIVLMSFGTNKSFLIMLVSIIFGIVLIFGLLYRQPSSFDTRYLIWEKGIEALMQRPILGWGLENYEEAFTSTLSDKPYDYNLKDIRVDKAHNEFLEIGVASGTVGLVVYLLLLAGSLQVFWRRRKYPLVRMSLISLVAFILLSSVNVISITLYYLFYVILGYAAYLLDHNETHKVTDVVLGSGVTIGE